VPSATAVIFTGVTIGGGGTLAVHPPRRRPLNVLIYGDSITEGVRTLGYEGIQNDTDRNDAVRDYSYQLSQSLPVEIGVVGFGATGTTHGGSGGVPALPVTWNQLWDGEPRVFSPPPDLVIYNEGTNDGSSITATLLQVVKGIANVAPMARQLLLLPFNGCHETDILEVPLHVSYFNCCFSPQYSHAKGHTVLDRQCCMCLLKHRCCHVPGCRVHGLAEGRVWQHDRFLRRCRWLAPVWLQPHWQYCA